MTKLQTTVRMTNIISEINALSLPGKVTTVRSNPGQLQYTEEIECYGKIYQPGVDILPNSRGRFHVTPLHQSFVTSYPGLLKLPKSIAGRVEETLREDKTLLLYQLAYDRYTKKLRGNAPNLQEWTMTTEPAWDYPNRKLSLSFGDKANTSLIAEIRRLRGITADMTTEKLDDAIECNAIRVKKLGWTDEQFGHVLSIGEEIKAVGTTLNIQCNRGNRGKAWFTSVDFGVDTIRKAANLVKEKLLL